MSNVVRKTTTKATSARTAKIGVIVSELEKAVPVRTKADPTSCAPGAMYCA
ncbi:hypothetical protein GCM10027290_60920 [Micromonospora sonneratiae]|uniref:Uncharacterized protein n=1 Tax=Micromonospora sonneratiae TaxID=1184706 RepID=A0ABW3YHC4_9ACTN